MSEESCIHGLEPGRCSICKERDAGKASQATLSFSAIENAVKDLADRGNFRTKEVARHQAVQRAHSGVRDDPSFNQHVGMYLTDAVGRLGIEQVSAKGVSNATWRRRA